MIIATNTYNPHEEDLTTSQIWCIEQLIDKSEVDTIFKAWIYDNLLELTKEEGELTIKFLNGELFSFPFEVNYHPK